MAGGVSRFPTLTFAGGCDAGGWLVCAGNFGAAPVNGGAGNSKLGSVGAPGRRVFKGWGPNASSAVAMPGAGTARAAKLAEGSRGPPAAKRSASASERDGARLAGIWPVNEFAGFNVQSRPPEKAPEGVEGSRRGELTDRWESRPREESVKTRCDISREVGAEGEVGSGGGGGGRWRCIEYRGVGVGGDSDGEGLRR